MTTTRLPDGPMISLRLSQAVAKPEAGDPADPKNFPAGPVEVTRGWLKPLGIGGAVVGGAGVVAAGVTMLRAITGGVAVRPNVGALGAMGAAVLLGGAMVGSSFAIGPKTVDALATGIPTRDLARKVEAHIPGRTKVIEADDGTFAIVRDTTPRSTGGGSSGGSRSGGSRPSGGSSGGGWSPSYPSTGGGGSTSRGDDSGSSRNSTSNGNPSYDDF